MGPDGLRGAIKTRQWPIAIVRSRRCDIGGSARILRATHTAKDDQQNQEITHLVPRSIIPQPWRARNGDIATRALSID
jgi:hypothetical protein